MAGTVGQVYVRQLFEISKRQDSLNPAVQPPKPRAQIVEATPSIARAYSRHDRSVPKLAFWGKEIEKEKGGGGETEY